MVNNPLIRPYLLGGGCIGGAPLDSHDIYNCFFGAPPLTLEFFKKKNSTPVGSVKVELEIILEG